MRSPEGTEYPIAGEVRDFVADQHLGMSLDLSAHPADWHALVGELGGDSCEPMSWNVSFADEDIGQTRLTLRCRFATVGTRDSMLKMGMGEGWMECFQRLDSALEQLSI